jgi:hypothetical protein
MTGERHGNGMPCVNQPGLWPTEGQKPGICSWTRAWNQLLSLSLGIDKTPPHYHTMVINPAFHLSYIRCLQAPSYVPTTIILNFIYIYSFIYFIISHVNLQNIRLSYHYICLHLFYSEQFTLYFCFHLAMYNISSSSCYAKFYILL